MPSQSKIAGLLVCGAGAYTVSQAFTSVSGVPSTVLSHGFKAAERSSDTGHLYGSYCSAACAVSGVAIAAGAAKVSAAASKRRSKVRVMALAQDDEELAFQPGQRVSLLAPPAMAGKQGTVLGPDLGDKFKVQLESGSIFSIETSNINGGGAAPAAAAAAAAPVASYAPPVATASVAPAQDDEELAFQPGERVTLLAPPAMNGKQGAVVGPVLGDTFAVQLDSGSIFNIATQNLQGAGGGRAPAAAAAAAAASYAAPAAASATPAQDDEELAFQPGETVTILAPPAMAGKQATVVGPVLGDTFACQLGSGSVFNIATENLQGAGGRAPAAAAPAASYAPPAAAAATAAQDDEELAFQPGEKVTLLAPPAMAGKQATVVGPAGDTFACQLDSGSIFNIAQHNIQGAGGYTPPAPAAAPAVAAPVASYTPPPAAPSATQSGDKPEFEKGQPVEILAPPALAGKRGTIGGAALDDCWLVVLASGSVFNIKTQNLRVTVGA